MSNNHKYPYEAQQKINGLERQLKAKDDELNTNRKIRYRLEQDNERLREVQNQLGKWVSEYSHCMRVVDYCGSLEDANEMDQYLYQLTTKSEGGEKWEIVNVN